MSDRDIHAEFIAQAHLAVGQQRAAELVEMCWNVESLPDVSVLARTAG
jgi:hypothetical protein